MQTGVKKATQAATAPLPALAPGDQVRHKAFGVGMVIGATPMGNDMLLEIAFDNVGTKRIMANFAKLEKI